MTALLITHTDLDGCGCAVLWKGLTGGPYRLVENGDVDAAVAAELGRHDEIVLADHSVKPPTIPLIEEFVAGGGKFTMLDHHKSALPLKVHKWATVTVHHAGTWLLWKHLGRRNEYREFATLVQDHDLWIHKDERSAKLAALLGLIGQEAFIQRFSTYPAVGFRDAELLILAAEDRRREEYISGKLEDAQVIEVDGRRWAIVYAESYRSDLAQAMTDRFEVDATAVVNANSEKVTVSLRGRTVDVSLIAERHGGGGHERAAAFSARTAGLDAGRRDLHEAIIKALGPEPD